MDRVDDWQAVIETARRWPYADQLELIALLVRLGREDVARALQPARVQPQRLQPVRVTAS
jgi:hypothetical protein